MDKVVITVEILPGKPYKGKDEFRAVLADGFDDDIEITFAEAPCFLSRPAHEISRVLADLDDDVAAVLEVAVLNGVPVTVNGAEAEHGRMRGPMGSAA